MILRLLCRLAKSRMTVWWCGHWHWRGRERKVRRGRWEVPFAAPRMREPGI
jgi:hypothetical protein